MAENIISNEVKGHDGVNVTNWISQINAGGTVYDIATHHGITFKDGKNDKDGVTWTGLSDLEIVIPNITDIVQSPIEFAGTVAGGKVEWNATHTDGPKTGYLVFVTENCEFEGHACEAGDMAIYDGAKWNIVSGENQVKIVGATDSTIADGNRTVVAVGAAKDVLVVEGKALSLTLDYADLNDNHLVTKSGKVTDVVFDTMTVGSVGIKLNKDADVTTTIGEEKDIVYGTELANGTVDLTGATGLVNGIIWGKFDAGTQTTSKSNTQKDLTVTGGSLTLSPGLSSGDFVESVVINPVTFKDADDNEAGSIKMLTSITAVSGAEFFNGIHVTTDKETPDLTITGYISPVDGVNAKYVKGLEGNLTPVTSITTGEIKFNDKGTDFATGFGAESASGDVVSRVSVTANNNTSVLNTAKVENHVLSFGSTNVTSGVTTELSYKSLTKGAYDYTAPVATNTSFTTSGFERVADVKYTFGRGQETTYTTSASSWKLDTPALTVSYGKYGFDHTGMKADVPAGTFVTSVTAGNLPSLGDSTLQTVDVTGKVDTKLTTAEIKFNALKSNSINMPGAYTLSSVSAETEGAITVGKAGALAANKATIDLSGYLTGAAIVEKKS